MWRPLDLLFKQMVNALVRKLRFGRVPFDQQLLLLGGRQQRKARNSLVRLLHDCFEQTLEMAQHSHNGGLAKEIGAVFHVARKAVASLLEAKREVVFRCSTVQRQWTQLQAGEIQRLQRRVLQDEHYLEQWRAAQITLQMQRIDELLKRKILMRIGTEGRIPRSLEQFVERQFARKVRAENQIV